MFEPLYDVFYYLVSAKRDAQTDYRHEEAQDLPAVPPNLWKNFSQDLTATSAGGFVDPRFGNDKHRNLQCHTNMAVWWQCVMEHAPDGKDYAHPKAAQHCKRYHELALQGCHSLYYKNILASIQKENFRGLIYMHDDVRREKLPGHTYTAFTKSEEGVVESIYNWNYKDTPLFVGDHYSDPYKGTASATFLSEEDGF